jgi:hypothetical protein
VFYNTLPASKSNSITILHDEYKVTLRELEEKLENTTNYFDMEEIWLDPRS